MLFKSNMNNFAITNTISIFLSALFYASLTGIILGETNTASPHLIKFLYSFSALIGALPLLYISLLTILWFYQHKKFGMKVIRCLWRQGYTTLE